MLAGRWHRNHLRRDLDDLIGAAFVGLVKASRAFDPTRGLKFSALATKCITNELTGLDAIEVAGGAVIARKTAETCKRLREYAAAHGRLPRRDEIDAVLGRQIPMREARYLEIMHAYGLSAGSSKLSIRDQRDLRRNARPEDVLEGLVAAEAEAA